MTGNSGPLRGEDVAIVGMAGRFPGADNVDAFWANVRDGVESIRRLTDAELTAAGVGRAELDDPGYVKACPVLDDVDKFDASFFGFSPREASVMDPAHRLFLEVAWEAVENAGYTAYPEEGPVGVFAGAGAPLYMMENLRSNPDLMRSMGDFLVRHTGNDMNFLATRVSYEMDLRGPSMNVQTACSSALTAVHLACQSLTRGDCNMALAGGSTVLFPHVRGYHFREGEILSPDGHCRPFDAKSAGTVFGSGAGVVVLKRLSDALDDGDTIHAVIKGSAINNDGAMKVGYLAPGVEGQVGVVTAALKASRVTADSISYIEAHGTGTLVGDPIEVEALNEAFRPLTNRRRFCAIGSVKSNIGHLGEAAGIASLIKAVMALKYRQLPPSLGFQTPNPAIDLENSPFFVNGSLRDWDGDGPRRCGVTALGAGGTNCHVILEEAPAPLRGEGARRQQLLVLSAATKTALDTACDTLALALEADPSLDIADAAFTLASGRRPMAHRRALAVASRADAITGLREHRAKRSVTDCADETRTKVAFMFPGGGAQYAGMGRELYEEEEAYREAIDACLDIITPVLGRDLSVLMFPPADQAEAATRTLESPSLTLPALFATEYAMARLFQSWGIEPAALIGHSVGEYAAACLAGVMSLEDALRLVMMRGRLFEVVEKGGMLSVPLGEIELRALLPGNVDIAAINAPDLSVASGPTDAIRRLQEILSARGVESTPVRIDVAAHSAMLDPVLGQFRDLCGTIAFRAPEIPFISNVTGAWITPAEATSPEYWVRHLRSPVRFADGLSTLRELGELALLEVGPGRTLCMLAKAQTVPARHTFNSMRHPQEPASDLAYALTGLGRLWCAGVGIDWSAFYEGQLRNRIPLPTYPFERRSFWVEPGASLPSAGSRDLVKRADIGEWFYSLGYVEAPAVIATSAPAPRTWLLLAEDIRDAHQLARALGNEKVLIGRPGGRFEEKLDGTWTLDLDNPEHYVALLKHMEEHVGLPDHVVLLTGGNRRAGGQDNDPLKPNFLHPVYLLKALGALTSPVQLSIVTTGVSGIGGRSVDPPSSLILGPSLVGPREFEHMKVRCIDMPGGRLSAGGMAPVLGRLVRELRAGLADPVVALAAEGRWVQRISPMPLPADSETSPLDWVRENGVYLITGGLGGIGMAVAERMAKAKPVRLALLSRDPLPPETQWDGILARKGASRATQRIEKVRSLRELGAQVMVISADVADEAALARALAAVRRDFGPLTGVIHAAGVMDDAPLMNKTIDGMKEVLAPKVAGTLALDAQVHENLDVFLLFSSVASCLGLPGQVDYTAANAFQDAFAKTRSIRKPGRTVVVNWNAWRDIGMAAAAHRARKSGAAAAQPSVHPAFDGYTDTGANRTFVATLAVDTHWMLAEHVVKGGVAVLPGTGFVELARAAFAEGRAAEPIEISDLTFISPFRVEAGERRTLTLELTPLGDSHAITMRAGPDPQSPPIVTGEARTYRGVRPNPLDLPRIRSRCTVQDTAPDGGRLDQDFMAFGPRWANIRRISRGAGEALIELSLGREFQGDLPGYGLHPALLDMATGGAQALIPGADLTTDFYVPMAYGAVRVLGPMPARIFSHVRCLPDSENGVAFFDVTLSDVSGRVFADISRFTMRRLDSRTSLAAAEGNRPLRDRPQNDAVGTALREGIAVSEGLEALDRIMAQPGIVQVAASSVDLSLWRQKLDATAAPPADTDSALGGFQRPELANDYAPPTTPVEAALSKIWSELLGVRLIGVRDNFFDLGGNSLSGVRLLAAIRRQFQVSLPLAILFEAQTIADLAALLPASGGGGAVVDVAPETGWSPMVRIKAGAPGRTPFFFIHGSRGNVLVFKALADMFGPEQPFYALQAAGVDGKLPPDQSIEVMAARYLAAIRKVQPQGPYILAGYSGGGVIAYEITRILKQAGEAVEILMMVDTLEPNQIRSPVSMLDRIRNLHRIRPRRFLELPQAVWKYRLRPRIRKLMKVVEIEAPRTTLENASDAVDAAYHHAQYGYKTEPLAIDIVLVRALDARMAFLRSGPTLGWGRFVTGEIRRIDVDSDHDRVFEEPSVTQLAAGFKAILAEKEALRSVHAAAPAEPEKIGPTSTKDLQLAG